MKLKLGAYTLGMSPKINLVENLLELNPRSIYCTFNKEFTYPNYRINVSLFHTLYLHNLFKIYLNTGIYYWFILRVFSILKAIPNVHEALEGIVFYFVFTFKTDFNFFFQILYTN